MDPVTHAAIGMTIAKVSGNGMDFSNPASAGIIIGAVFPDIDILLQKWGDYVYLKNHRCATHSVPGLVISAALISVALLGIYQGGSFFGVFLWTLLGLFSHTAFDILNSYGAKLLWPFVNRKFALSLLIIFDPVVFAILVGVIMTNGAVQGAFLSALAAYIGIRALMRMKAYHELKGLFKDAYSRINVLPSINGLFRWHFIIEGPEFNTVGEKNLLRAGIKIIERFKKEYFEEVDKAIMSPVGEFFSDFTPLFHVACEKIEGVTKFMFIDMRYYMKNKFLHHAFLELNENDEIIKASFNPYSKNRSNYIPLP